MRDLNDGYKALLDQPDQIFKACAMPADTCGYALNVVQDIIGNLEGLTETGSRIGEVAGKIGGILRV